MAARNAIPRWHGVPVYLTSTPGGIASQMDQARALGSTAVTLFAQWNAIEPSAKGQYDVSNLELLDRAVLDASDRGLKVLLRVRGSPCWASTEPPAAKAARPDLCQAYPPENPKDFGDFVGLLASRYAGRLAGIEIWPEPDHADGQHLAGPDRPGHFAALLKAAHTAVIQSSAPVPVLIGALTGANGNFLKALYRDGIKGSYEGVAVDFYDIVLASVRSIHQLQLANGDSTPVWEEEFGWITCTAHPTIDERYFVCVNPQQQARNLDDAFRGMAGVPWIAGAIVFTLRDSPTLHFGISDAQGNPKPAFAQLQQDFLQGVGPTHPVTVRMGRANGSRAVVGTAPVGDVISLQVKPPAGRPGRTFNAYLRLTVYGTFTWPLPAKGGKGWRVYALQTWTGRHASMVIGRGK